MTFFQWRRFNFFDLKKDVDQDQLCQQLQDSGASLRQVVCGRGCVLCADDKGFVRILNRQFQVQPFQIFHGTIQHICSLRHSGVVAAVGKDSHADLLPVLKVFDLDKPDKSGNPTMLRVTRLMQKGLSSDSVASCMAIHDCMTMMAVGFSSGALLLLRGDITKDRGCRMKLLLDSSGRHGAVSGLWFKVCGKTWYLYVATESGVHLIDVSVKDKEVRTQLDSIGCPAGGLTMGVDSLKSAHFVMACHDAVYFYSPEGRRQCYAIKGDKAALYWFRNYLVLVIAEGTEAGKQVLSIFDLQNKFVAYTAPVRSVMAVSSEWGMLYTVSTQYKVSQLTEKDIQSKLDLLFKKNCYDIAVKIAKSHQYGSDGLVDIFRQYGDHLYSKGDLSGAIDNYIKTVGHLEPSYVIRRFLDAHKIHNLTAYLQALHKEGLANEDHTTLLLNCYTKLKDNTKLDEFIFKDRNSVDFDIDIAIKVCRQSGYNQHALSLAEKHHLHAWYLEIELEDLHNYTRALDYIASLEHEAAEISMKKYGSMLMRSLPDKTTQLLKALCSGVTADPGEKAITGSSPDRQSLTAEGRGARPEDFLHLFVQHPDEAIDFLESIVQSNEAQGASAAVYCSLLEHYLYLYNQKRINERKLMAVLQDPKSNYDLDHVLILCRQHGFYPGMLYLFEKKGLYSQILKHQLEQGDIAAGIETCRRFGSQNPNIWVQALQWVASDDSFKAHQDHFTEILSMIERHHLMSPLLVVRTLAASPASNLGMVRQFLMNVLKAEDKQRAQDEAIIQQYRMDTVKIKDKLANLKKSAITFQLSKCVACSHPLELPSVHFLCQHSYHQHCFDSYSDVASECPACYQDNKKILDILKSQQQSRDNHDSFHSQLEKAEDGFSVVADYFGRGMFRPTLDLNSLKYADMVNMSKVVSTHAAEVTSSSSDDTIKPMAASTPHLHVAASSSSRRLSPVPTSSAKSRLLSDSIQVSSSMPSASPAAMASVPTRNPFEKTPSTNPFGDPDGDDDYDSQLNPFS